MLQADNAAHVVRDDITGVTAYISYKGYASDKTLLAQSAPEIIVMERTKEDGSVVMSVCTPDLGITKKGYTTTQPSQPLVREVIINGVWKQKKEYGNVVVKSDGGKTIVTATCIHGQPVEFELIK